MAVWEERSAWGLARQLANLKAKRAAAVVFRARVRVLGLSQKPASECQEYGLTGEHWPQWCWLLLLRWAMGRDASRQSDLRSPGKGSISLCFWNKKLVVTWRAPCANLFPYCSRARASLQPGWQVCMSQRSVGSGRSTLQWTLRNNSAGQLGREPRTSRDSSSHSRNHNELRPSPELGGGHFNTTLLF